MGAINSTLTFELETLSQHRHLIERLQDEVFYQRSQIEEQHSHMENMQSHMEQMERNHQQPNTPASTQGASRNLTSATVNQVPDLNEPATDPIWEQHGHSEIKKEPGS
jgi:methyl-accepting chemotaxis protein